MKGKQHTPAQRIRIETPLSPARTTAVVGSARSDFAGTDMQHHDLASWLRREHRQVQQLADRLHERVAIILRVGSASWTQDTQDCLGQFREHLQKHMALEGKEGYMEVVLERRPTLSDRVGRLMQEHRDLIQLLDDLRKVAEELKPDRRLLLRDFCQRVQLLLSYVEHHENEENDLVGMVFCEDLGTKD